MFASSDSLHSVISKSEYRSTKSKTNSKSECSNDKNYRGKAYVYSCVSEIKVFVEFRICLCNRFMYASCSAHAL